MHAHLNELRDRKLDIPFMDENYKISHVFFLNQNPSTRMIEELHANSAG